MKTIVVGEKQFNLDIWEELRVKDLRKMQPIVSNRKEGDEIEMIIKFIKAFSSDGNVETTIDNLTIPEFTTLGEGVTKLFNVSQDKKKV